MRSMLADSTDSFDDFFAALANDHVYGDVTFQLKAGKVVHITYHRNFLTLQDARNGLVQRSHEEEPRDGQDLHQDNFHSQTR